MLEFIPFFIVLIAGLFFSELFLRFQVPWVIALIIGGIIIGPTGFGIFETNTIVGFFSEIGLIFLMFMAGLESNLFGGKRPREGYERILKISIINTVIPFVVGMIIALSLGYSNIVAFLIGTVFASTSVAVLLPSLESMKLLRCGLGRTMINVGILNDVISLTLLSIALNSISKTSTLSVMTFVLLFIAVIWLLRVFVPKIIWFFEQDIKSEKDLFQQELRTILFILVGVVILFELIGLDPVISGFFAYSSVKNKNGWESLRSKFRRLMIPWIVAVLTLIPLYKVIFLYSRNIHQENWTTYFLPSPISPTTVSPKAKMKMTTR